MKIRNVTNVNGRAVPNQFIITEEGRGALGNFTLRETFQSYESIIVERTVWPDRTDTVLDELLWDYSKTTGRYRNQFTRESKRETEKKIKSGEYTLANLNHH